MPHRLYLKQFGTIHALPILHYRMEFAHLVREAVRTVKPDCIAIELPPTLEPALLRGIARLPRVSVISYQVSAAGLLKGKPAEELAQTVYLIIEPADPLVEAARLALEQEIPLQCIDLDLDDYPLHNEALPDSYAVQRIGLGAYYREYTTVFGQDSPDREDLRREKAMAFRLQQLAARHDRILLVCGMYHLERLAAFYAEPQGEQLGRVKREGVQLFNLHPDSTREILGEYPFLSAIYEARRGEVLPEPELQQASLRRQFSVFELIEGGRREIPQEEVLQQSVQRSARQVGVTGEMPDRQRVMLRLFEEASRHYRQETGESVRLWQRRAFFRFTRNYALVSNMLLPDLYQMLSAARSCVDDNFAHAFWRLATYYQWQEVASDLPTLRLRPEDMWGMSRRIRFRPRPRSREKELGRLRLSGRKREQHPGEWLKGFDDPAICSYPPEDLMIEEYGRFLRKKGMLQLSEEQCRVEPFAVSMLDGIDMRATLRNLHEGRIYVRENQRVKGGVGSLVVVFDEDPENSRFPSLMTWLGEHEQESDMAFYATSAADTIVGPGISRCEYGGFMLSYPPRRMLDVWQDRDYAFARSKSEILLLAALDYSRDKHVIYAASRPPRSIFRQLASRLDKKIIFIPLASLSPVKLKKLRVFHVLHGNDKRKIARDYIW